MIVALAVALLTKIEGVQRLEPPPMMVYHEPGRSDTDYWSMELGVWADGRVIWHSNEPMIPTAKPASQGYYYEGQIPVATVKALFSRLESMKALELGSLFCAGFDISSRNIVIRHKDRLAELHVSGELAKTPPHGEDPKKWAVGYNTWSFVRDFQKTLKPKGQHEVEEPDFMKWVPRD